MKNYIFYFLIVIFLAFGFALKAEPPGPPVLLYPSNGFSCAPVSSFFDWQNVIGATSYRLQVSASPLFTNNIIDTSGLYFSEYSSGQQVLLYNTLYYWRANASNSSGTGNWSNTFYFITSYPTPSAPQIIYPQNGTTNTPLTFTFSWYLSHNASAYRLQISQSSSFTNNILDSVVGGTQMAVRNGLLNYSTVYYWRINAFNCGGTGSWSAVWAFLTGPPTNIQASGNEIPGEFKLYNNFPNPFNPVTRIFFDIPETTPVKLGVFDINGREIDILLNGILKAGKYSVDWSGQKYSSGIYLYKLSAGNFISVKKMFLIK